VRGYFEARGPQSAPERLQDLRIVVHQEDTRTSRRLRRVSRLWKIFGHLEKDIRAATGASSAGGMS
jgi:hypothetical protein